MAITEEQRAILIERLKKGREAAAAKKKAAAAAPATKAPKAPKAPKETDAPAPVAPATKAPKGEVIMRVKPLGETEFKEIRMEDPEEVEVPEPTPTAAELYVPVEKPAPAPAPAVKRSAPIDIPHPKSDKKAAKDKGYMKLKFYTQPSPKVLKKLMAIHDESSSDEDSEDEVREMPKKSTAPAPAADNERKMRLKQAADYYFNYY